MPNPRNKPQKESLRGQAGPQSIPRVPTPTPEPLERTIPGDLAENPGVPNPTLNAAGGLAWFRVQLLAGFRV